MVGSTQDILSYLNGFSDVAKADRYFVVFGKLPTKLGNKGYSSTDIQSLGYQCELAELPGRAFATFEARAYGPNIKYPYQSVYNDITLQFYCTGNPVSLLSSILSPLAGGATRNLIGGVVGSIGGQLVSSALNGIFGNSNKAGLWEKRFFDDWMETINPSAFGVGVSTNTNNASVPQWNFNYKSDYITDIIVAHYDSQGNPTYTAKYYDAFPYVVNHMPVSWADDSILRMSVVFAYKYWHVVPNTGLSGFLNALTSSTSALVGTELTNLTGSSVIGNAVGSQFGKALTTAFS